MLTDRYPAVQGVGVPAAAAAAPAIVLASAQLEAAIASAHDGFAMLEERLGSVLQPERVCGNQQAMGVPTEPALPPVSPLFIDLAGKTCQVQVLNDRIRRVLDLLDL